MMTRKTNSINKATKSIRRLDVLKSRILKAARAHRKELFNPLRRAKSVFSNVVALENRDGYHNVSVDSLLSTAQLVRSVVC